MLLLHSSGMVLPSDILLNKSARKSTANSPKHFCAPTYILFGQPPFHFSSSTHFHHDGMEWQTFLLLYSTILPFCPIFFIHIFLIMFPPSVQHYAHLLRHVRLCSLSPLPTGYPCHSFSVFGQFVQIYLTNMKSLIKLFMHIGIPPLGLPRCSLYLLLRFLIACLLSSSLRTTLFFAGFFLLTTCSTSSFRYQVFLCSFFSHRYNYQEFLAISLIFLCCGRLVSEYLSVNISCWLHPLSELHPTIVVCTSFPPPYLGFS